MLHLLLKTPGHSQIKSQNHNNSLRNAEREGIIESNPCQGGTVENITPNLWLCSQIPKVSFHLSMERL